MKPDLVGVGNHGFSLRKLRENEETRFVYFSFFRENHWSWNEVKLNYTRLKKKLRGKTNKTFKEVTENNPKKCGKF